jgi:hypothetical protein
MAINNHGICNCAYISVLSPSVDNKAEVPARFKPFYPALVAICIVTHKSPLLNQEMKDDLTGIEPEEIPMLEG